MTEIATPLPDEIHFRGSISREEFVRIQSELSPVWLRWYVVLPIVMCILFVGGPGLSEVRSMRTYQLVGEFGPFLIMLLFYWGARILVARWTWKNNQKFQAAVHGVANASGIEWNSEYSQTRFPWENLLKARDLGDLMLVHYTGNCGYYFPRHFFATETEWAGFKALLRVKVKSVS
jgi:hypothetical protein